MLVPDHYSATWQFVLPDSLRILCCCGDAGLTHVDRSTKAFGSSLSFDLSSSSQSLSSALTSSLTLSHGGLVSPYGGTGGGEGVAGGGSRLGGSVLGGREIGVGMGIYGGCRYPEMSVGQRVVRCNVLTLAKTIECAGSCLHFLLQVQCGCMYVCIRLFGF